MDWWEFCEEYIPEPATIVVEAFAGSGGYGDVYDPPVTVEPCVVEEGNRLVRVQTQDAAGTQQVSSTTVYAPLDTPAPPGSMVTVPSGRRAKVLAAGRIQAHGHPLPEHLELNLE